MSKKSNNSIIKVLVISFLIFFMTVAGYEYFQYGSIFNNTEHFREIYSEALVQKSEEDFHSAIITLSKISPRYEAYDAVLFQQAQCYAKIGDEASVQRRLKYLINKYPQSYLYIPAKYDLAKSFLRSQDNDLAKEAFVNIINNHKNSNYEIGSYYYLASIYANKKNDVSNKYYLKYIEKSQDGNFSQECVQHLLENDKNIFSSEENYYIGLVYYYSGNYSKAIGFLQKAPAQKAWLYLAKANIKNRKYSLAKQIIKSGLVNYSDKNTKQDLSTILYDYVDITLNKNIAWQELSNINIRNSEIKDIILYNKAKFLSKNDAVLNYKIIVNKYFSGDYSSEALKILFWNEYNAKNYRKAKEYATKHVSNFQDTKSAPHMNYWLAKIYEIEGNYDIAKKLYNRLLAKYPDDYYAMRAYGRIQYLTTGQDFSWDFNYRKTLNQEKFELNLPYSYSEIKAKFGATLAELLLVEDFNTIDYFYNFDEPFIKSWIYYKKGLKSTATTTARNAMEAFTEKPDRTDEKWRFIYPCYFANFINKYAQRNKISPYLLISLIREESYFNPLALSVSNAVGLTQILPSTAKEVSLNRGYGQINEFLLFNPEINIKYGAAYFSQIKQQLNNTVYAVAAYNAGAGAVSSWLKKTNCKDMDEFIERIPYPETENYVKKIYRSYWNYTRLYSE